MSPTIFAVLAAVVTLIYGYWLSRWVVKQPTGSEKMVAIASAIQTGAKAYLVRQYKTIAYIAFGLFIILVWF